jgi:C-8 sterol isomerase
MAPTSSSGGIGRLLYWLAVLVGVFTPIVYLLEKNLESFYVFDTDHLHDVSKRAIAQHGNNTAAIVDYIVQELEAKLPGHINTNKQDWFFNNAGGAMGGVRLLHASELPRNSSTFPRDRPS